MKGLLKAAAIAGVSFGLSTAAFAQVRLQGAGATFPQPLYERWVAEYSKARPGVQVDYKGIGSGGGIKSITEKTVDFAGSDAPLTSKQLNGLGGENNVVQVPSCAGGVVPAYNLPGVSQDLKFTGEVLAQIFMGKITQWNDPKIAELNQGVQLPSIEITPAWRTDGSGTTFVFTNYLATQSSEFKSTVGTGTQVKWPLGQGGKGNPGVTAVVQQTPGAIGYIEQNYATANNIPYGAVQNKSGKFVKATPETISHAGAGAVDAMNGTALKADIWNQPGDNAYPIASFTYLIAYKDMNNIKSQEQAQALVNFLHWATHDGQAMAGELQYAPLAEPVQKKVEQALSQMTFQGKQVGVSMAIGK